METGLAGKTAVVTGAASGIGLACSRALAAEGATVVLADLNEAAAQEAAREVGGHAVAVDVTKPEDARRVVEEAVARGGALDVLVACAGAFHATPLDRIEPDEWDRIQDVNLRGVFLVSQAALEVMMPRRSGRIVTIASLEKLRRRLLDRVLAEAAAGRTRGREDAHVVVPADAEQLKRHGADGAGASDDPDACAARRARHRHAPPRTSGTAHAPPGPRARHLWRGRRTRRGWTTSR